MKKVLFAVAVAAAVSSTAQAAIVTTQLGGALTPTDMVNLLLANNSGITISNVQYTGANNASGTFTGGAPIGINSGILLTSGSVGNVVGPNTVDNETTNNGLPGDADLDGLTSDETFDASVLSFSFVPTGNRVTFSYVFGSEEYNEFVNLDVNDVFGFFINGVNVALLPGTSTPVSVDTVNCGNPFSGSGPNCNRFRNNDLEDGGGGIDTELDGLTTVLFIDAAVNPGQSNTMKIAISDAGDSVWDSAVFIEGGTLTVCGGPNQPPCDGGGGDDDDDDDDDDGEAPEPMTLALFGLGLAGLRFARRR